LTDNCFSPSLNKSKTDAVFPLSRNTVYLTEILKVFVDVCTSKTSLHVIVICASSSSVLVANDGGFMEMSSKSEIEQNIYSTGLPSQ